MNRAHSATRTPLCMSRQTRRHGRSAPHLADSFAPPKWPSGLLAPQAWWRWTTAVRPREASIVQHSCLHTDPTNVVASPSSWSPQPRVPHRRAASIHYLRSAHITGCGPERYPRESMTVVSVMRVRARDCICGRHDSQDDSVNSDIHSCVRHSRNDFSRFRDTRRWGRIRGTTWNVWRHCMV